MFFAPEDFELYPVCGMFSLTHIIVTIVCLFIVFSMLFLTTSWTEKKILKFTKVLAIILTFLELIKIGYNFYHKYLNVDSWVPLSFCSIFIFSTWFAGYGKGFIQKMGQSFIAGGCVVAGFAFLIFPTTSLTLHPMFHYLSCYSMFFHSAMFFMGILFIIHKIVILNKETYKYFVIYTSVFMVIALIMNFIFKSNLMFLDNPYNVPVSLVKKLGEYKLAYMLCIIGCYLTIPYFISALIEKIIFAKRKEVLSNVKL